MNRKIEKTAKEYQELDRKIKDLQEKQKSLKQEVLDYAAENQSKFDSSSQLKFPCGLYVKRNFKERISATIDAKLKFLDQTENQFKIVDLDEKALIESLKKDKKVQSLAKKIGISVVQKEMLAVYAN